MQTENKIKILGFAGSLRKKSYNQALLRAASELKPEMMELEIFHLDDIPMYNEDLEKEGIPEPVKIFKDRIAASDSLLISTPEYNYSVPGVLKNAIDWASRTPSTSPLQKKTYALMGVSSGMSGTMKAQMHMRQIGVFNNMFAMNKPEVYVTFAKQKFNEKGELTDEPTREHLKKFLAEFYEWTIKAKNISS